jgi:hypothetical protein
MMAGQKFALGCIDAGQVITETIQPPCGPGRCSMPA